MSGPIEPITANLETASSSGRANSWPGTLASLCGSVLICLCAASASASNPVSRLVGARPGRRRRAMPSFTTSLISASRSRAISMIALWVSAAGIV